MKILSTDEIYLLNKSFVEIEFELQKFHSIFYEIYAIGKPVWNDRIKTAAIEFDQYQNAVQFIINPAFWKEISFYDRCFVVCHEMLHIILKHGDRDIDLKKQGVNQCLDVVINHMLVNNFGFDRDKLTIEKKFFPLCWVDTVFNNSELPTDQNFEYYYNLFLKENPPLESSTILDCHDFIQSDKILKDIEPLLSQEAIDSLNKIAGTAVGGNVFTVVAKDVKPKKKWESVIKNWSKKYLKKEFADIEQWAIKNRRMVNLSKDLFLPSEILQFKNTKEKQKIDVFFFQDTSGSCVHLADRFFKAALSLNPKKFKIRLFCFDTQVYETTLESRKLYGWGGTRFDIIEHNIQAIMKAENIKYPEAVFVITDGYGTDVYPKHPKKWYWFLSSNYRAHLPQESNIFMLSNFE